MDDVLLPVSASDGAGDERALGTVEDQDPARADAGVEDSVGSTRLDDSDDEGQVTSKAMQEQSADGKLVINGIEGTVALPGFDVGLMSRNAMKESLENAVQSFRSKSVVGFMAVFQLRCCSGDA